MIRRAFIYGSKKPSMINHNEEVEVTMDLMEALYTEGFDVALVHSGKIDLLLIDDKGMKFRQR